MDLFRVRASSGGTAFGGSITGIGGRAQALSLRRSVFLQLALFGIL